ncbi:MAG: family 43 glycosylhydrolase [Agathobacter sp.]|nr:family 43 glycosylhydrolase [Agathobacter sp.]
MNKDNKQALNPYLPLDEYVPDGEVHVFGDRVYLFGSHDKEAGDSFCLLNYVVWSAPIDNLSNWSNTGVTYSPSQDPLYDPDKMAYLFAPDVVQGNDGRFYLYYCMSGPKGKGGYSNPISVAVSDSPDGKYEYLGVVRNPDGTPLMKYICFDPAVINDDGTIRLYYGTRYPFDEMQYPIVKNILHIVMSKVFGRTVKEVKNAKDSLMGPIHVELAEDMLTVKSEPARIIPSVVKNTEFEKYPFFEASSIRKIGDTYYFVYSSMGSHELCYATSKYPDRDFTFRGVIISNADIGFKENQTVMNQAGNNHGCIECVNGQWYVFYQRHTHGTSYSRQACAEKIDILSDGSIPMVEMTSCGLNAGPLPGYGTYSAAYCCNISNKKMKYVMNGKASANSPCVSSDGEKRFVTNISDETLVGYKYFQFKDVSKIGIRYRGNAKGNIFIYTEQNGKEAGKISIEASSDWTTSETTCNISNGVSALFFVYKGKGKIDLQEFTIS